MSFEDEKVRRKKENDESIDSIFTPHATSYNSAGDTKESGRKMGSTNNGNEVNESKQEYDQNYEQSQ